MRKRGFTLVEIMIVVAIIALLAAIAIPNLLRARVNASQANAQATLKTLSTACESWAAAHNGNYPLNIAALTGAVPPYLNEDYTAGTRQGYTFACNPMDVTQYSCTATPTASLAGADTYNIVTGGVLTTVGGS
jgi:type IV pilus assembly protein PilA